MRIRGLQEILEEIASADVEAQRWHAVAGQRRNGIGEDLYLGHPNMGVFHLKSFAKNPYRVRGVGTRVARKIDDDLEPLFPGTSSSARFGLNARPADEEAHEERLKNLKNVFEGSDRTTDPGDFFESVMEAIESPAHGPMAYEPHGRPSSLDDLSGTFDEAEDLLTRELDDLIRDEGVDRGFY